MIELSENLAIDLAKAILERADVGEFQSWRGTSRGNELWEDPLANRLQICSGVYTVSCSDSSVPDLDTIVSGEETNVGSTLDSHFPFIASAGDDICCCYKSLAFLTRARILVDSPNSNWQV